MNQSILRMLIISLICFFGANGIVVMYTGKSLNDIYHDFKENHFPKAVSLNVMECNRDQSISVELPCIYEYCYYHRGILIGLEEGDYSHVRLILKYSDESTRVISENAVNRIKQRLSLHNPLIEKQEKMISIRISDNRLPWPAKTVYASSFLTDENRRNDLILFIVVSLDEVSRELRQLF